MASTKKVHSLHLGDADWHLVTRGSAGEPEALGASRGGLRSNPDSSCYYRVSGAKPLKSLTLCLFLREMQIIFTSRGDINLRRDNVRQACWQCAWHTVVAQ